MKVLSGYPDCPSCESGQIFGRRVPSRGRSAAVQSANWWNSVPLAMGKREHRTLQRPHIEDIIQEANSSNRPWKLMGPYARAITGLNCQLGSVAGKHLITPNIGSSGGPVRRRPDHRAMT
jgi:hypothetical protein